MHCPGQMSLITEEHRAKEKGKGGVKFMCGFWLYIDQAQVGVLDLHGHIAQLSLIIVYLSRTASWPAFCKLKSFHPLGYTQFDSHMTCFHQLFPQSGRCLDGFFCKASPNPSLSGWTSIRTCFNSPKVSSTVCRCHTPLKQVNVTKWPERRCQKFGEKSSANWSVCRHQLNIVFRISFLLCFGGSVGHLNMVLTSLASSLAFLAFW